jgi:hypothetical protein
MSARLCILGLWLLASACSPALTMRRLSPPKAVLGTAHTVHVHVTPAPSDVVPGETERVSEAIRRKFSERLTAAGYAVCPQLPCGDGVLEVVLDDVAFDGKTPSAPPAPKVSEMTALMDLHGFRFSSNSAPGQDGVRLVVRVTLTQAGVQVGVPSISTQLVNRQASVNDMLKEAEDAVVSRFGDELGRQTPLVEVPLEGGGPLNRGVEMLHAANWAGAVTYFTELTRTQPELDGAWYDLGFAHEAQNEWAAALEAYRQAAQRAKKPHYTSAVSVAERLLHVPSR